METAGEKKKPLSGVRKWWREQLDAPHPQSRTNSVPICPCVYCFHGGDPHPGPRSTFHQAQKTSSTNNTNPHHNHNTNHHQGKPPLYSLQQPLISTSTSTTTISSYSSLAPLIQKRNSEGAYQTRAPEDPAALLDGALAVPDGQVPDQVPRPVERVEQHGPGDQELAGSLDGGR